MDWVFDLAIVVQDEVDFVMHEWRSVPEVFRCMEDHERSRVIPQPREDGFLVGSSRQFELCWFTFS
jgi:hypothetical protein